MISDKQATNLILNIGTLAALLIALIVGGFVAADLYSIVHDLAKQSKANGDALNKTITEVLQIQQKANMAGNESQAYLSTILGVQLANEKNIIGNLTNHRIITNISRDNQNQLLEQILNQTKH